MSYNAFSGRQRERVLYIDGDNGYDHYLEVFEDLKRMSTDEITTDVLVVEDIDENPDKHPIACSVSKEKVIYVEKADSNDVKFILDTKNLSDKIEPMLPKAKKLSRIALVPDVFTTVKRRILDDKQKTADIRSEYPELVVELNEETVSMNGKECDLHPDKESIRNDVELFLEYMGGYSAFHGESEEMQYRYFEFANWFFCSPFMASLRDMAARCDVNPLPYPVFGLLYGQSKAGKLRSLKRC